MEQVLLLVLSLAFGVAIGRAQRPSQVIIQLRATEAAPVRGCGAFLLIVMIILLVIGLIPLA